MGGKGAAELALSDGQGEVLRHEIYVVDLTERERESRSEEDPAGDDPLALQHEGAGRVSEAPSPGRTLALRPFVSPRARACPDCFKSVIHVGLHRQRGGCRPPTLEFLVAALEIRAPHLLDLTTVPCQTAVPVVPD